MSYDFDLGPWTRRVSTSSHTAQRWFDRGLNWTFSFNHDEAVACFRRAAGEDPRCAMAWWGIAYAAGPFYNRPWIRYSDAELADVLPTCHGAVTTALSLDRRLASGAVPHLQLAKPAEHPTTNPRENREQHAGDQPSCYSPSLRLHLAPDHRHEAFSERQLDDDVSRRHGLSGRPDHRSSPKPDVTDHHDGGAGDSVGVAGAIQPFHRDSTQTFDTTPLRLGLGLEQHERNLSHTRRVRSPKREHGVSSLHVPDREIVRSWPRISTPANEEPCRARQGNEHAGQGVRTRPVGTPTTGGRSPNTLDQRV